MLVTSTMKVMPPPGQTCTGAPPAVTRVSASLMERVEPHRVLGHARAQGAARARHEEHGAERGLAVLGDAAHHGLDLGGHREQAGA